MEDLEQDIHDAATRLELNEANWKRCNENESSEITSLIKREFVTGSPRVWWLSLTSRISATENTPAELDRLLAQLTGDRVYFLPDPDDGTVIPVFAVRAGCINAVLDELHLFEFYILSDDRNWLISANDHNELILSKR